MLRVQLKKGTSMWIWLLLFMVLPTLLYCAIDYALYRDTDWRVQLLGLGLLLICVGWTASFAITTPAVS